MCLTRRVEKSSNTKRDKKWKEGRRVGERSAVKLNARGSDNQWTKSSFLKNMDFGRQGMEGGRCRTDQSDERERKKQQIETEMRLKGTTIFRGKKDPRNKLLTKRSAT